MVGVSWVVLKALAQDLGISRRSFRLQCYQEDQSLSVARSETPREERSRLTLLSTSQNHPDHLTPLITPSSLLRLQNRAVSSSAGLNPRYFQAYGDQKSGLLQEGGGRARDVVDLDDGGDFDSYQRHLQEMVVRNVQRAQNVDSLPVLSLRGAGRAQRLYTDLTKDIVPHVMAEGITFEDEDLAAMRIQTQWRGKMGRAEYEAELAEWKVSDSKPRRTSPVAVSRSEGLQIAVTSRRAKSVECIKDAASIAA